MVPFLFSKGNNAAGGNEYKSVTFPTYVNELRQEGFCCNDLPERDKIILFFL